MKNEWPPSVQTQTNEQKKNFEQIKNNFSVWVDEYLVDLYENGGSQGSDWLNDPVEDRIDKLVGNSRQITKEMESLTIIFADRLVKFCDDLIFKYEYNENLSKRFYSDLHKIFFSKTPTVFENLDGDFLQKILLSSKINETYKLRNIVDISGETSYTFSFSNKEILNKLKQDIIKLDSAHKITIIKQLSQSAMRAYGEGDWAERAFINIIQLIEEVKKTEKVPIVSFLLDYELQKIKNYSHNLNNFEEVYSIDDSREENLYNDQIEIKNNIILEDQKFLMDGNSINPPLDNVYYSKVSKDYGSVVLGNSLIPFALVKRNKENGTKNEKKEIKFSTEEIKNITMFLENGETKKESIEQYNVDAVCLVDYLIEKKSEDLSSVVDSDSLFIIRKKLEELREIMGRVKNEKSLWLEYDQKTLELSSLSEKINIIALNDLVTKIIEKEETKINRLSIKSYDGLTSEKDFNPLGCDDFSHLIKILHAPEIRNYINNRFKISIENLLLKEQIYFLKFISRSDSSIVDKLEVVFKKNNSQSNMNFLRSFLSMSGDEGMGDKILTLGEKLPEEVAQKVFVKYGEIIDNVSKITEFAKTNFTKEIQTNPELIKKIEETLYIKGKQLLSQTYYDINDKKEDKEEINYEDIGNQLDRINADTITTFAIFKQAVKNGEKLPIESIEGSIFSKKEASVISREQRREMSDLYDKNYENHSDREFISEVKKYFNTAFIPEVNQPKNHFYLFEKDNKIRAFVRFEKKEDKSLYASALNVDEASKNFGLGEAMMDEALSCEAKENILRATCLISNPSNMRYFEKGFISNHFKSVNETNQFDLVWDEKKNINILAKQKNTEDLLNMYLSGIYEGSIEIKKEESLDELHKYIPEGKALVRCFMDPKDNNIWYAVYEKLPDGYGLNTSEIE